MANATVYKKKKTSLFKSDGWKRFRKNKLAVIGLCVILFMVLAAIFAPVLVQNDPYMILETPEGKVMKDMSPSASGTILGTDNVGRDELSRLIYGARVSMSVGIVSVGISLVVGVLLGAVSGYFGGWLDSVIMRIVDMFMAVPAILLSMAVVAALGNGTDKLLIALSIAQTPRFTRVVRSSIMTLRNQEFVEAAKCCGTSSARIIFKHILPNGMGPVIVSATLTLGQVILNIASLGFLGIGAQTELVPQPASSVLPGAPSPSVDRGALLL